jgi:hypothetical protein
MVIEPPQENLIWRQPQQILNRLSILAKTVQLGMQFDINLREQAFPDDLPNQTQNEMFSAFSQIRRADVDDGTANGLSGGDDDVVIFCDLECVKGFALGWFVKDSSIDRVGDRVVNQFGEDEAVTAFVK